jgi:CBS-domain-containing membrane protein
VVLVDIPAFDELLLRHQIKQLPVVDPAGPLLGILSHADLLKGSCAATTRSPETSARTSFAAPCGWTRTPSLIERRSTAGAALSSGPMN